MAKKSNAPPPAPAPWDKARVSSFLANLFQPGTGHLLIGRRGRAVFWALTAQVIPLAAIVLGVVFLAPAWLLMTLAAFMPAAFLASAIDAAVIRRHVPPAGTRSTRTAAVIGAWMFGASLVVGVKRFAVENYLSSGNAMQPALLGRGLDEPCPACGLVSRLSARPKDPQVPESDWGPASAWCARCGERYGKEMGFVPFGKLEPADRILVNRFRRTPARWDIVVYRPPQSPTEVFVHRLVGLPGERIEFVDGELLVDGRKVARPADLADRPFRESASSFQSAHASAGNPVTLADDEYFVVGDYSGFSHDSRYWETGVPGRPPYAVPADHIVGTVTHIIWPPHRWRVFEPAE